MKKRKITRLGVQCRMPLLLVGGGDVHETPGRKGCRYLPWDPEIHRASACCAEPRVLYTGSGLPVQVPCQVRWHHRDHPEDNLPLLWTAKSLLADPCHDPRNLYSSVEPSARDAVQGCWHAEAKEGQTGASTCGSACTTRPPSATRSSRNSAQANQSRRR